MDTGHLQKTAARIVNDLLDAEKPKDFLKRRNLGVGYVVWQPPNWLTTWCVSRPDKRVLYGKYQQRGRYYVVIEIGGRVPEDEHLFCTVEGVVQWIYDTYRKARSFNVLPEGENFKSFLRRQLGLRIGAPYKVKPEVGLLAGIYRVVSIDGRTCFGSFYKHGRPPMYVPLQVGNERLPPYTVFRKEKDVAKWICDQYRKQQK